MPEITVIDPALQKVLTERQLRAETVSRDKGHTLPEEKRWGPMMQWAPLDPRGFTETKMQCTRCEEWVVVRAWLGPVANFPPFIGGMMFSPCWRDKG